MLIIHFLKKSKETGDSKYIYQNELDNACLQHDIAYGDFKDLNRITFSDKVLRDKAFNTDKDPKYDVYQRGLAQWVINFFVKNLLVVVFKMKIFLIKNQPKNYKKKV